MISVMLVEQEQLYQKVFRKIMDRQENCELVAIAENGMEAMKYMKQYHPQMVFSEALLGSENGIDVCRGIRDDFPETYTYILTEYNNLNLMQRAMKAGIERYLFKPLSQEMCDYLFKEEDPLTEQQIDDQIIPIIDGIEERDYRAAYEATEQYVDYIFDNSDEGNRKKLLKQTLHRLIGLIPGMEQAQKNYYIRKYELDQKIVSGKMNAYCWVISVITEIFRQLCVMKYAQMNKVFQYIESNIKSEISMADLAQAAGISSGYLSRLFKKYYHLSMVDYIHLRKLTLAKNYMIYSEMNISDISFLLGYSEAGYFCKIFKKYEKLTPSEYTDRYMEKTAE